ncbi:flagellar hook-basal body complex protein FliE [Neobacillus sp. PS3-34]|uniref:flagellar hook-basal body complex protein FliE n=1 Tax=Neobacillus sp. PS3-34 TaxID=3070678 RepID=UPI0027DF24F4|nr:flagellar hook-basal body complex protein FliE [Neobacillus sp. PS3-34]WML49284.1 flagellar hook-basal body complex protein FliE [Neobacillus sp. PS3-34]
MVNVNFPSVRQIFAPAASQTPSNSNTAFEAQNSFASVLKESINKVNETQLESDKLTDKLAKGENIDLHQVMISAQKASITMQATLEIRNKVIEAYQEIMRMQV